MRFCFGQGLSNCSNWLVAAGPNRPNLPRGLGALNGIERLTIQCEWFFSGDISGVLEIQSLKELNLLGGAQSWIDHSQLQALPKLKVLEMARHTFEPSSLAPLGQLEELYFGRGKKSDLPESVRGIAKKKRA